MPPPVLVTGASGFLGHALCAAAGSAWTLCRAGRGVADVELDLDRPPTAARAVHAVVPRLVMHLAALSRIGDCDRDPAAAARANAEASGAMAEAAAAVGARFVHVSTDLVFDGERAPYRATSEPAPRSVYGRTKADAERRVLAAGGIVVRVPLLFGPSFDGRRGATDMLRAAARDDRPLDLFENEFRTPLHVADAAQLLWRIAADPDLRGIVQLAGPERVSRLEFGLRFRSLAGLDELRITPARNVDPTRPADVSMVADLDAGRSLDAMLADS